MNWNYSGWPYSDDLYHHGIKGQRWGVRLYQNEDGTLTPLGKVRYGAKKVGETIGSAAKSVADHRIDKIKNKHPWMMNDEEIKAKTERLKLESAYLEARKKKNEQKYSRGQKIVTDILETSAKTMASKSVETFAKKLFSDSPKAVRSLQDVLRDPKATAQEIKDAADRFKYEEDLRKSRNLDRKYNEKKMKPAKMSRRELDNYNAWLKSKNAASKGGKP